MNSVIYEVNLSINKNVYKEFTLWLNDHLKEMLQCPGFMEATLLKPEIDNPSDEEKITVQYKIKSRDDLENYLNHHASRMRESAMRRFQGNFSAVRRILYIQDIISLGM